MMRDLEDLRCKPHIRSEGVWLMASVTIYTKSWCPYCSAAKELLTRKGVAFTELDITGKDALKSEMIKRSGRATVPHVGGCDDLYALDQRGGLDPLLAA
jgi:glutaredoxin 3